MRSVREAVEAEQLLLKSVNAPPDVLMQAARHFGSTAINVKKLTSHTSSGTANQNKAAMLAHLSDELGLGTQEYIKAVNEVFLSPYPPLSLSIIYMPIYLYLLSLPHPTSLSPPRSPYTPTHTHTHTHTCSHALSERVTYSL